MNAPGTHSALTNSALRQERGAASPPALPIATRPSRPAKPPPPPSTPEVRVDTADRLQGAECRVTVILHPLSGRHDATAFHLRPGGCASWHPVTGAPASSSPPRHRRAARRLPGVRAGPPGVRAKFPEGREANQSLLDHLRQCRLRRRSQPRCSLRRAPATGRRALPCERQQPVSSCLRGAVISGPPGTSAVA